MKRKSPVLKRVNPPSLELFLDDTMALVPRVSVDFSDEEKRKLLRNWMAKICGHLIRELVYSMTDATKNAVDEAGALMVDPDYYENSRKRRAKNIEAGRQREAERTVADAAAADAAAIERSKKVIPMKPFVM